MKKLIELTNKLNETEAKMLELKSWLDQKEVVEYYNWKSKDENKKDRTAMDKVVAQLKMNDESWLVKEQEYLQAKIEYDRLNKIFELVNNMLYSQQYTEADIEEYLENVL